MTVEDFYIQEVNKPHSQSCFGGTVGITWKGGEPEQNELHAMDEVLAFAEAYHKEKMNGFTLLNPNEVAVDEKYFKEIEKFFNNYA